MKDCIKYLAKEELNHYQKMKGYVFQEELIMKQTTSRCGYKMVKLRKGKTQKNCTVHRLVAKAFLENNNELPYYKML